MKSLSKDWIKESIENKKIKVCECKLLKSADIKFCPHKKEELKLKEIIKFK